MKANFLLFVALTTLVLTLACKNEEPLIVEEPPGPTFEELCCTHNAIIDEVGGANFFVPNNFTANNDGINDIFLIFGGQEIAQVVSLKIYDDTENLVFENHNFPANNPTHGWDGRLLSGTVEDGIYTYDLTIENVSGDSKSVEGTVGCRASFPLTCVDNEYQCVFSTQNDGEGGFNGALPSFEECQ